MFIKKKKDSKVLKCWLHHLDISLSVFLFPFKVKISDKYCLIKDHVKLHLLVFYYVSAGQCYLIAKTREMTFSSSHDIICVSCNSALKDVFYI